MKRRSIATSLHSIFNQNSIKIKNIFEILKIVIRPPLTLEPKPNR